MVFRPIPSSSLRWRTASELRSPKASLIRAPLGYAEKRGDYWRGRYKIAPGRYGTVVDATGAAVRFRTRRDAEQAANDKESEVRAGTWRDPAAGRVTFGAYVNRWFAAQD